jgi:fructokinase
MAQYGLIEAGGTKFVLGVADEHGTIAARHQIPTTTPEQTLGEAVAWLRAQGSPSRHRHRQLWPAQP